MFYVYRTLNTEERRFPYWIRKAFWKLNGWNILFAKVVHLVPLGALSGPGAPDPPIWLDFRSDSANLTFRNWTSNPNTKNHLNSFRCFNQAVMGVSMSFPNSLIFNWFYKDFTSTSPQLHLSETIVKHIISCTTACLHLTLTFPWPQLYLTKQFILELFLYLA